MLEMKRTSESMSFVLLHMSCFVLRMFNNESNTRSKRYLVMQGNFGTAITDLGSLEMASQFNSIFIRDIEHLVHRDKNNSNIKTKRKKHTDTFYIEAGSPVSPHSRCKSHSANIWTDQGPHL